MPRGKRKFQSYSEYVSNVVALCSHKWLIMENKKFREFKFEKAAIDSTPLPKGKHIKIIPARCKSYSCPICGRKKVFDLVDRLKSLRLTKYRFFTLTLRNKYSLDDTEKNINRINDCFNKLNKKLRKREGFKDFEYFKVVEVSPEGMVHIHGIWNKYIPIKQLSALWKTVTGDSYRVDVERIKTKNDAIEYLFKYMTKNVARHNQEYQMNFFNMSVHNSAAMFYEQGKRRYTSSRNFFSKAVKVTSDFLPYYYEAEEPKCVENVILSLIRQYGLKKEHFDLRSYTESDEFIENTFYNDSS